MWVGKGFEGGAWRVGVCGWEGSVWGYAGRQRGAVLGECEDRGGETAHR